MFLLGQLGLELATAVVKHRQNEFIQTALLYLYVENRYDYGNRNWFLIYEQMDGRVDNTKSSIIKSKRHRAQTTAPLLEIGTDRRPVGSRC